MTEPAVLGPFVLERLLGEGGGGRVWAAHHRSLGTAVAVKVLSGGRSASSGRIFENEARSVAALDHRGIVTVHDFGRMPSGEPWLVMERLDGGTLGSHRFTGWPEVRRRLLELLAALAHAHARGVVHRDIKSSNVLLSGDGHRTVLTDFGMAQLRDAAGELSGGTPSHMPPEQFEGRWRDYGPWTDLYALGAMAWGLVTGRPPFGVIKRWNEALRVHRTVPLPPLVPLFPVPVGLEDWLGQLLAKDPGDRFGRAADAAEALRGLLGPLTSGDPGDGPTPSLPDQETVIRPSGTGGLERPIARGRVPDTRGALVADWRALTGERAAATLLGTGLGLFGLRRTPLAGREAERDVLWDTARAVVDDGASRGIVLRGPAGCGKSRLASWLVETLHAAGAAEVLRAVHQEVPGPLDGLGAMVRRWLKGADLDRDALRDRIGPVLARLGGDPDEVDALVELCLPTPEGRRAAIRLASGLERHRALWRLLVRVSAPSRPVVLWLDDVQYGADALRFAEGTLTSERGMLVICTAQEEALAYRRAEASLLTSLQRHAGVVTVPVGPLPEGERPHLVQGVLGLDASLAADVERRTGGNPLFALQLVGDWVQRDLLEAHAGGFRLRDGADVRIPDDVHAVWGARVDQLLAGRPVDDTAALELAAVLGLDVDTAEWADACARAGLHPTDRLVDGLLRRRLVEAEDPTSEWRFVHGMLRESLERRSLQAGRLPHLAAAAAAAVEAAGAVGAAARAGQLRLRAGQHDLAWELLLRGAREYHWYGDYDRALELADILEGMGLPDDDPRCLEPVLLRAEMRSLIGQHDQAMLLACEVEAEARARGWRTWLGRALLIQGQLHVVRLESAAARRVLEEAEALLPDEVADFLPRCRGALALIDMNAGRYEEAHARLVQALEAYERSGSAVGRGRVGLLLGTLRERQGDLDGAIRHFGTAFEAYRQIGARMAQAVTLQSRAMCHLEAGDVSLAEVDMEAGIALAKVVGHDAYFVGLPDFAAVRLARGRTEEARALLAEAEAHIGGLGSPIREQRLAVRWAPFRVHDGDRQGLARCIEAARDLVRAGDSAVWSARALEAAADGAHALGWREADDCRALALAMYEALQRTRDVRRMRAGRPGTDG